MDLCGCAKYSFDDSLSHYSGASLAGIDPDARALEKRVGGKMHSTPAPI